MKGLLHSKLFLKNLRKWLLMYVGVLGLFTTVITYSRYITSLTAEDSARVAKFKINTTALYCKNDLDNCNTGYLRPTSDITYYFNLDTDLEVKTSMYLTILLNEKFTKVNIYEIADDKEILVETTSDKNKDQEINSTHYNAYSWFVKQEEIGVAMHKEYKVVIRYNEFTCDDGSNDCPDGPRTYTTPKDELDILRVGYSAIQLAK